MNASTSSGQKSANTAIMAMGGKLTGFTLTAAAATATLTIYDNATTNSGTILDAVSVVANSSAIVEYTFPVCANNGIYAVVSGAGATYTVRYQPGA
jgi:hypothetical protein